MNTSILLTLSIGAIVLLSTLSCTNLSKDKQTTDAAIEATKKVKLPIEDSHVYFETFGDSSKPALFMIHGNGGSLQGMKELAPLYTDKYYVIAADNRSHGNSGAAEDISYRMMSSDFGKIIEHLALDSAYILGQSDGGIIGLLLAIEQPGTIKKVVAVAPNLVPGPEAIEAWELELSKDYIQLIDSMINAGDTSRNWKIAMQRMQLMKKYPNISLKEIQSIECPVLIMGGDDDIIKLEHLVEIYHNIEKGQLCIMPAATHFMMSQDAERFHAAAQKFLNEPFTRPRSKDVLLKIINGAK